MSKTVYQTHFGVYKDYKKRQLKYPKYPEYAIPPEEGDWEIAKPLEEFTEEQKQRVKDMNIQKFVSTYKQTYVWPKKIEKAETGENILVELSKATYKKKPGKINLPLNTSRRIFGYMHPKYFYTDMTTYQIEHGKTGYKILDKGFAYVEESIYKKKYMK